MTEQDSAISTIQQVHGTPSRSNKREGARFDAFKRFFLPRLKQQEEIAIAYEEATVRKLDAEGEKLIQEAAKLAAEKDIARQQELKAFCENVDAFFSADDPPHVVMLKFAKLIEVNPEIAGQLERVNSLIERLNTTRSLQISFKEDANAASPESTP